MRKRHCARTDPEKKMLPCLTFSFEQLTFLKRTLAALVQVIHAQTKPMPNLDFAAETVAGLQIKIDTMLTSEMWGKVVEMDANEILMLQTSVWVFTAALDSIPDLSEKKRLRKQCETIGFFLATVQYLV
jgi:hypothetical protein